MGGGSVFALCFGLTMSVGPTTILHMKRFVNIPEDALVFIDRQVAAGKYRSRSHAITQAIYMLRDSSLYASYLEAFSEIDPVWDTVISDGVASDRW